jgi:DNA-binding response OmpR family regulator
MARALRKLVPLTRYIVVVEPDDLICELLERWLGEAGYEVVVSAKEDEPGTDRAALVIADVSRPDSAAATIAALQAAYAAPILALSTRFRRGLGGSIDAAHELGVRNVLPKPFSREELLGAIDEAIRGPDRP